MTAKVQRANLISLTQPPDWVNAWKTEAAKQGIGLSEWIGNVCNAALPLSKQRSLSPRGKRGVKLSIVRKKNK